MSNVLYFPNLKSAGNKAVSTGTEFTDAGSVVHTCLDVAIYQKAGEAIATTFASTQTILLQDFHDASTANINAVGGAFVAFGSGVTIPSGTKYVQISSTCGEPIQIAFAANLGGAAASTAKVYLVPGGAPGILAFIPATNNLAFVKSLSSTALTDGYITMNFIG